MPLINIDQNKKDEKKTSDESVREEETNIENNAQSTPNTKEPESSDTEKAKSRKSEPKKERLKTETSPSEGKDENGNNKNNRKSLILGGLILLIVLVVAVVSFIINQPESSSKQKEKVTEPQPEMEKPKQPIEPPSGVSQVNASQRYSFPSKKNVTPGEVVKSNTIQLKVANGPMELRVVKGEFKLNQGGWDKQKTVNVENGDLLTLRHKASVFNKQDVTTSVFVDNKKVFTFSSITK